MSKLDELFPSPGPSLAIPEFPPHSEKLRPSRGFRPAGSVLEARWATSPLRGIKNPGSTSRAAQAGKRYERKVLQHLSRMFAGDPSMTLYPAPWIAFATVREASFRHCQPDFLLETPDAILLCEIKLSHTLDAFWQLEHLYGPVVSQLFPKKLLRKVEITRSFDPAILFPKPMRLFFSFEQILRTPGNSAIEVLQWKL